MTPTTNERNRFEAWAKDTMSLVKEPGGYKEATTHHAWRAWQAALTREQREGDAVEPIMCRECGQPTMHLGSLCFRCSKAHKPQQEAPAITQCPKCDCWFEPPGTPTSLPNGSLLKSMTVQQEAPGAVACWRLVSRFGVCSVWLTGDISADAARQAIADGNRVERAYTTPPAPVDVRVLATKWNRQAEGNFDDRANALSRCADELRALIDGQQAGVDDEAARKAVGDVFKSLPNSGPIKHHGRFG